MRNRDFASYFPKDPLESECENGYSLLETLIALAVLALGATISVPNLGLIRRQVFQLDVAGILSDLKTLRDDAMLTGVSTDARITSFGYMLEPAKIERHLRSGGTVSLTSGEIWTADRPSQISFYSDGSSSGGVIILNLGKVAVHIVVDPLTAHARETH